MTTPILIDCDPGHDDAIALLLALASPEVELVGVSAVAGNATLAHTTANAIRVLDFAGRPDIPVAAGAARPLVQDPFTAEGTHGSTGLDGPELPPPSREPDARHAEVRPRLRRPVPGGHRAGVQVRAGHTGRPHTDAGLRFLAADCAARLRARLGR